MNVVGALDTLLDYLKELDHGTLHSRREEPYLYRVERYGRRKEGVSRLWLCMSFRLDISTSFI
jgi:hypothetical protein